MSLTEFLTDIRKSAIEKFAVIYHGQEGVAGFHVIAEGNHKRVSFVPNDIFRAAATCGADTITLIHNHPTGAVRPSQKDLATTFEMQDMLKARGMALYDHVILGPIEDAFSFRDNGVI